MELCALIVEDEHIIRESLHKHIPWENLGFGTVLCASNGKNGLELIEKHRPCLVVTDVRMPLLDGIGMLEASIEIYGYKAIIVSGYEDFVYAQKAVALGVSQYLLKPISFRELEQVIKKIVSSFEDTPPLSFDEVLARKCLYYQNQVLNLRQIEQEVFSHRDASQLYEWVKANYTQKLLLADLSDQFRVSGAYLSGKFKESTGYAFNDFVNRYRIVKAIELLAQNNDMIYEISKQVGFEDYRYFIMVFKKYLQISPAKFFQQLNLNDIK